jgi:hypothetical protein
MDMHATSIRAKLQDRVAVERALIAAARDAAKLHRAYGVPVVIARDGEMVEVPGEELERECDRREAALNASIAADKKS